MKSCFSSLYILPAVIAAMGCKHSPDVVRPVFNTQVFVDFSITRGEDPGPFYVQLKKALADATYPIRWPEEQSSMGVVMVTVEDDNLAEVHQAFQRSLTATGRTGAKIIGIRVIGGPSQIPKHQ